MRLGAIALALLALSQGPVPATGVGKSQPPERQAAAQQQQPTKASPPAPAAAPQARAAERAPHENGEPAPDWWMIGLTAGMLGVAVVQAALFWRQLGIMDDTLADTKKAADAAIVGAAAAQQAAIATEASVDAMRDSAQRQLRAYVSIEGAGVLKGEQGITVQLELKNTGQTPARNVVVTWKPVIGPPGDHPPPPPLGPDDTLSKGNLGSGCGTTMKGDFTPRDTTNRVFWANGQVDYTDIFDRAHVTRFCLFHHDGKSPPGHMGVCHTAGHNDSD